MGLAGDDSVIVDDGDGDGDGGACGGKSFGLVSCSICLEAVTDNGDRSWAKLQCGHEFHLDCIGSAFNIKDAMQCPNCRKIENGQWLYANGSPTAPEFSVDDWTHDEDLHDLGYFEMMMEGIVARMHLELRDQFEEQLQHQQQQINTLQRQVLDQGRMMEELFSRERMMQDLVSRLEMLRPPGNNSDDNC